MFCLKRAIDRQEVENSIETCMIGGVELEFKVKKPTEC
jgi:hypothetical protein